MNWYICTTCGRYSYSAADPDTVINGRCPQPDCAGYTVPDPEDADADRSLLNRLFPVAPGQEDPLIRALERVEDAAITALLALTFVCWCVFCFLVATL